MGLPDKYIRAMRRGWFGGLSEGTVCGKGSTMRNTETVRAWLPRAVEKLAIRSVCDAGAGDLHWISSVPWNVEYRPVDLVPRHESVSPLDITVDMVPRSDLILCRHVLQHLPRASVEAALDLFRRSGSTYLAATHFPHSQVEREGAYNKWDMVSLGLGPPQEETPDDGVANCFLSLWRIG